MYLNLHCVARSTVAGETRPLIKPVTMPTRAIHCSAMPSWESKPLVSAILPSGPGTLYNLPSVRTPSTSISSRRTLDASCVMSALMPVLNGISAGRNVAALACPVGVEELAARLVHALVGVRAEVIALRLQQVRRQPLASVAVKERDRGHKRGHGDSSLHSLGHYPPPATLAPRDDILAIPIQQQVAEIRVGGKCSLDLAEERAADDAAGAPHHGDFAVFQIPLVFFRRLAQQHEALGVADDLRSQQRLPDIFDIRLPVAIELDLRPRQNLAGSNAIFLHGAQASRIYGLADQRHRNAEIQRTFAVPLAGTLLPGAIQNLLNHSFDRFRILVSQDVARDFDQVAVELTLIPLGGDRVHFFVADPEPFLHELVCLAAQLHVTLLDAVVLHH